MNLTKNAQFRLICHPTQSEPNAGDLNEREWILWIGVGCIYPGGGIVSIIRAQNRGIYTSAGMTRVQHCQRRTRMSSLLSWRISSLLSTLPGKMSGTMSRFANPECQMSRRQNETSRTGFKITITSTPTQVMQKQVGKKISHYPFSETIEKKRSKEAVKGEESPRPMSEISGGELCVHARLYYPLHQQPG